MIQTPPHSAAAVAIWESVLRHQVSLRAACNPKLLLPFIEAPSKRQNITVTIGKKTKSKKNSSQHVDKLGLTVQTLSKELSQKFKLDDDNGVGVTNVQPGSVGALACITTGKVNLQVNRTPVNTASEFTKLVNAASKDKRYCF